MSEVPIQIVDKNDKPLGSATKEEAWKKGLIHRIVHVVVQDERGRLLLQKRTKTMQLYPNRWTDSASGHVDEGENWMEAAKRELAEEIGLEGVELREMSTYFQDSVFEGRILKRFNRTYAATVSSDTQFAMQTSELTELKWFTAKEIRSMVAENPEKFTPTFAKIFEQYL